MKKSIKRPRQNAWAFLLFAVVDMEQVVHLAL